MREIFAVIFQIYFMSVVSLIGLGCQSVDIAFKKQQIKVRFFRSKIFLALCGNFQ